jgi:hypothetical protein
MSGMARALVGREPVLATADAALDEAMAGAGQFLLISGEPGIGKSALLAELATAATARGARVLRGGCWDGGGTPAYWPWTQVLRAAVEGGPGGPGLQDLGPAARLLTVPAPHGADPAPVPEPADPAGARFQLLDAVGQALARLAARTPVMVALDDLQWADEPSLHLLEFLSHRLSADAVLLVGAYRDADAGPTLRTVLGIGQQLPLVGLTAAHVRELMIAVAASQERESPPERLVAQVWRRSGGNPFFVKELTRLVLAQGGWNRGGASDQSMPDSSSTVPDTVLDTLERRLARLSQPCAEVLAVAAVAGIELREEVLASVVPSGGDRPPLAALLAEAAAGRVLVGPVEPVGRYRFSHDLYRETILLGMTPALRCALHLAVGRALEALWTGGAQIHLAEVAGHLLASDADEARLDAVRFCAAAAAEAMARLGYEDARRHYERALAGADRVGDQPALRIELLLGLADARYRAGDGRGARADLHRAVELTRRVGDVAGLARAAVALHDLGARGAGPDAVANVALLTEAAAALPPEPSALRARVLTALVRSIHHQHAERDQDRIVAAGREAVRVARAAGEPSALAFALLALHDAIWEPGSGKQRLEVLEEMRSAAVAAGDRDLVAQTHQLRAAALLDSGDPRGRTELARYIELIAARGDARGEWEAMTRTATLAAISGQFAEADRLATRAVEYGRGIGEPDADGVHGTLRGALLLFGSIDRGWDLSPDQLDDSAPGRSYLPMLRAVPLIANGDLAAAGEALAGFAVDDLEATHDLEPLAILAAVIAPAGSDLQRQRVYERLEPYAGLHAIIGGCASYWGAVDHHLGELAAALAWRPKAIAHLEAAITAYRRLGAPGWARPCIARLEHLRSNTGQPDPDDTPGRAVFRFDGASWELTYQGKQVHLPDAKGLRDIARLLSTPGRPIHVHHLLGIDEPTGADPQLDDRARRAYRTRLTDLDAEIEQAQAWHDPARADKAIVERDALLKELAAAAGLAGRARRLGDTTERARKTVTARIRDAVRRIDLAHPELAEHLRATITTGTACSYTPQQHRTVPT